jgi:glutamine synthetase adenylyltransferase
MTNATGTPPDSATADAVNNTVNDTANNAVNDAVSDTSNTAADGQQQAQAQSETAPAPTLEFTKEAKQQAKQETQERKRQLSDMLRPVRSATNLAVVCQAIASFCTILPFVAITQIANALIAGRSGFLGTALRSRMCTEPYGPASGSRSADSPDAPCSQRLRWVSRISRTHGWAPSCAGAS